jgi:two-component system KDP operon response regulator KdpE
MNKTLILVIDDEPQMRKLLDIVLDSNGFAVMKASSGTEGISLAASHSPDLIILDLGLPDKSGHDVLLDIRQWYANPIIILSVQNQEENIVKALDNGADDYLAKPFRTGELIARIKSSLRRSKKAINKSTIAAGDITIEFESRTVLLKGSPIKLTSTEYNLLALLAKNEGKVLTHSYILKEVWGASYTTETQYLRVFIAQLRKKVETNPNQPKHILTESGIGYRFVGESTF